MRSNVARLSRPGRRHRSLLTVGLAAVGLLVLSACAGSSSDQSVTVYSGRSEELIDPILSQCADDTDLSTEVRYGDSAELALLISEEGQNTPADVFISQSPGAVGFLDEKGLLAPLGTDVLTLVDETNEASDGSWVGLSGRKRVLVYNTDMVDPADLPDSVLDLTDPAFDGQVGLAPSNGSFQDFVTAMRNELGDAEALAWLEGMADNGAESYSNNTAIVEAVGRGEVPMGLVNHYYNYRVLAENPDASSANYDFDDSDIGSVVVVTAAAVLEPSGKKSEAEQLIGCLLGTDAQTFFAQETLEYPLAAGVEASAELPPLDGLSVDTINFDELGGGLEGTVEMIEQSGL